MFREILEISIFVGIISAATVNVVNSYRYIVIGSVIGIVSSIVIALLVNYILSLFDGQGIEVLSLGIISLTITIIGYTIVRMRSYNIQLKKQIQDLQHNIKQNSSSALALISVVAFSIIREGCEIILFLQGVIASDKAVGVFEGVIGAVIGAVAAILVGCGIYSGLVAISPKYLFRVTFILLTFIAAGMAAEAVSIMTAMGIITVGLDTLWDSTWLVSNTSLIGKLLGVLVGYTANPSSAQVVSYILTLLVLYALNYYSTNSKNIKQII